MSVDQPRRLPRRIHDVRPREHLDKVALIAAFAIGCGGTLFLKLAGVEPAWLGAIFAAAVLVAYAVVTWMLGRLQIEPEAIGDNCYYLGFLFTLTSLAITLWQLANSQGEIVMRDVIAGFGIALGSTIVGVFLRVFLMQIRVDFVARDREARLELHVAAREFRGVLAASIAQIKAFSIESVQLATERNEQVLQQTEEFQGRYLALIEEGARAQQERQAADANALSDAMRTAMTGASERLTTGLGETLTPALRSILGEVRKSAQELKATLTELREAEANGLAVLGRQANEVSSATGEVGRALTDVVARFEGFGGKLTAMSVDLESGMGKATAKLIENANVSASRIDASLAAVEAAGVRSAAKLEASLSAAAETVASKAATSAEGIAASLASIEAATARAATALRAEGVEEALSRPISTLDRAATKLLSFVERLDASTQPASAPPAGLIPNGTGYIPGAPGRPGFFERLIGKN